MEHFWTLGGLTWRELLIRTMRASWADSVFGQAARLGFYHFLALFPSLLLLFFLAHSSSGRDSSLERALVESVQHLLPVVTATLVSDTVSDLRQSASQTGGLWLGIIAALWASINGAWAMIDGLNAAFEVKERRSFYRVTQSRWLLPESSRPLR